MKFFKIFQSQRVHLKEVYESHLLFGKKRTDKDDFYVMSNEITEICDSQFNGNAIDIIFKTKSGEVWVDANHLWDTLLAFANNNNIRLTIETI